MEEACAQTRGEWNLVIREWLLLSRIGTFHLCWCWGGFVRGRPCGQARGSHSRGIELRADLPRGDPQLQIDKRCGMLRWEGAYTLEAV